RPAYHAGALPRRLSQRTICGSCRDRTGNLSGANRALSQLELRTLFVESTGLEPVLPRCHRGVLPAKRQPQHFVDQPGIEPGSPTCEAGALPSELSAHSFLEREFMYSARAHGIEPCPRDLESHWSP